MVSNKKRGKKLDYNQPVICRAKYLEQKNGETSYRVEVYLLIKNSNETFDWYDIQNCRFNSSMEWWSAEAAVTAYKKSIDICDIYNLRIYPIINNIYNLEQEMNEKICKGD